MLGRITLAVTAAALAAAVLLLGGVLRETAPERAGAAKPPAALLGGSTEAQVLALQAQVRARPDDARSLARLGLAYEQRARETADSAYLTKADGVLRRALRLAPRRPEATIGLGSLALSRHDFRRALALGRRARVLAPEAAEPYAIAGDALVELGRYDEAFATFDELAADAPGVAAYARIAYGRELLGNRRGAIEAMKLAATSALGRPEASAWTRVELGKLLFGSGQLGAAARSYRAALRVFPGYPYALDALAHVEAASGRYRRAASLARRAVAAVPLPQFITTLGDVLWVSDRRAQARERYALVGAVERLLRANGVRADLEIAQFYADHGVRLPHALRLARKARAAQPGIEGDDVLAWTLARNGRCGDALHWSQRALRLGTQDAVKLFHRGMIERCAGHQAESRRWLRRALSLNPHFSLLWSPVARRLAR
ncbi:MAG: tetratricopeptide repeat protein [Gaiellaceae bacterium]